MLVGFGGFGVITMTCPKGHKRILLIEYARDHPERYDGVSEVKPSRNTSRHCNPLNLCKTKP